MDYIGAIFLSLLNAVWLFSIAVGLPGTWLMIGSAILLQWGRQVSYFSPATLIGVVTLAAVAELLEFATGVVGAAAAGGTRRGAAGALVGGLLGGLVGTFAIPVPLIGSLIGACLGAAGGTILLEVRAGMPTQASLRAGLGAGIGRLVGTVIKLTIGAIVWLILTVAAFWP